MRSQFATRALLLFFFLALGLGVAAQVVFATGDPGKRVPTHSGLPKVSGNLTVGETLTASHGRWIGAHSYAYKWERCNPHGARCHVIPRPSLSRRGPHGLAPNRYAVALTDVGHRLRVKVIASGANGKASATSRPTGVIRQAGQTIQTGPGAGSPSGTVTVSGTGTGSPTTPPPLPNPPTTATSDVPLVGDAAVETNVDANAGGQAQAWQYVASASGVSSQISFYVDPSNDTSVVTLGVYSDVNNAPDSLLGSASFAPPDSGGWNTVVLPGVPIAAGTKYWLAALGADGYMKFRDKSGGSCSSQGSADIGLSALPATWTPGPSWTGVCPASFYITGGGVAPPQSAPGIAAAPTLSGVDRQGQVLTTTAGTWTAYPPPSYSYAWKDCDTSGGNCATIAGATGSRYTLQADDVGHTVRSAVTATNQNGHATAQSDPTSVIQPPLPPPPPVNGISVSGNKLVDDNGDTVVLRGVDRAGTEYMCSEGFGITDGPSGNTEFAPMSSWGINSVFIGLNEDCWLGINGVQSQYGGQNYIDAIKAEVAAAEANNLYPVVGFFWGDPGSEVSSDSDPNGGGQPPLPDNDHAPLFWQQLADTFKSDPNVIFRLQEEPHPAGNSSGSSAWSCWSQGDVQYSPSSVKAFGTAPTPVSSVSNCNETATDGKTPYSTVGMQSLLNIIRGTGATNVVQVPGVQYANMMACTNDVSPASCGFLQPGVRVTDTLSSPQLMADVDVYPDYNPCNSTSCYNATYAPIIAQMPFEAGETGPQNNTILVDRFLTWMDGQNSGYYAWAWDTWAGLISNFDGTAQNPWGTDYKAHLAAVG